MKVVDNILIVREGMNRLDMSRDNTERVVHDFKHGNGIHCKMQLRQCSDLESNDR